MGLIIRRCNIAKSGPPDDYMNGRRGHASGGLEAGQRVSGSRLRRESRGEAKRRRFVSKLGRIGTKLLTCSGLVTFLNN